MRKWIVLLLTGALLIGLLSGCAQNPFSVDSRVKNALEKVYDTYGADALSLVQEIEMSFSGREQDMTMTQSSRASFVGRGTDTLTFHMDSDGSSSIDGVEKYELVHNSTLSQNISVEDVRLTKALDGEYTAKVYNRVGSSSYKHVHSVKKGVASDNLDGDVTKSDWLNPMAYYQTAATGLWGVHHITEDDIQSVEFRENGNGDMLCTFKMSKSWKKRIGKAIFGYVLAAESAKELFAFVEDDDYTTASGKLTYNMETGALTSFDIRVTIVTKFYKGMVGEASGLCGYSYKMYVTPDTSLDNNKADAA